MGPNFGHDNSGGGEKSNGYGTLAQSSPGPIAGMAGRGAGARSPPMTAGFSGENGRWNSMDNSGRSQGNGQGQLPHFQAYEKNLNGSPSLPPLPHSDSPWSPHTPSQPYGSPNQLHANANTSPHHQSWNAHLSGAPSSQLSPSNSVRSPLTNSNSNSMHGYPPPQSSTSGGSSRQLLSPYAGTTDENEAGNHNERLNVASNGFGFLGPVIGTGGLLHSAGASQLPPPIGSQSQQFYNATSDPKSHEHDHLSRIEETSREIEGDSYDVGGSPFGEMEGEGEDKMQGEVRIVKRSFEPTMPDELIVFVSILRKLLKVLRKEENFPVR